MKVKQAPVAIVDTTLITANARPNTVYKETSEEEPDKEQSKDVDARWLKKGLKNGLMYQAFRNKRLTRRMKQFNKLISKTSYRIEQGFGTIKRRFRYQKASYFTTAIR
ncbi:MAG: IS5 family transposase [Alphaproteobacteria bacterium]